LKERCPKIGHGWLQPKSRTIKSVALGFELSRSDSVSKASALVGRYSSRPEAIGSVVVLWKNDRHAHRSDG
jgi:hypothetical protein